MKDDFTAYRTKHGYSLKTIKSQDSYINRFKSWLITNKITLDIINNQTILNYIFQLKEENVSSQSIRNHLQGIRVYLDYQIEITNLKENPATQIHLRSTPNKTLKQSIVPEILSEVFSWFTSIEPINEHRVLLHQRDTVVLGLLLFQGLDSGDIERLTTKDINLKQGTIYIPSARTSAARTLCLESTQILPLQEYLQTTRNQLNTTQIQTDKLFIKSKIQDMVSAIVTKVKNRYPEITDPRHIRSSVIQNWLKTNHIRRVQYMAGHRSIISTERYRKEDLYDLSQQISKYHPIK